MSARTYLYERAVFDSDGYLYTLVIWQEGGDYYFAQSPNRQRPLDDLQTPELIPKNAIFGRWAEGLTEVSTPIPSDVYVKLPPLTSYAAYGPEDRYARDFAREAETLEALTKGQHPNICEYYGCRREGDLVTGICLKRYEITLLRAMKEKVQGTRDIDADKVLAGIQSGVDFIHSLGLIHNDLHPSNIMLDRGGTPIIIDFDACVQEGVSLVDKKQGTPNWCLEDMSISKLENDQYGLLLIKRFLLGTYDPTRIAYSGHATLSPEPKSE